MTGDVLVELDGWVASIEVGTMTGSAASPERHPVSWTVRIDTGRSDDVTYVEHAEGNLPRVGQAVRITVTR